MLNRANSHKHLGVIIYRIYSINRPGRLLIFLDLESGRLFEAGRLLTSSSASWMGSYSRGALIRGWRLFE